jgi:hypothetical protein
MPVNDLWVLAIIASRCNLVWVATVCSRMRTDYRFTNTLAWNTFPVPTLTNQNKADLTRCAEDILLVREAHFPATIADLYEVKDGESKMPEDLRAAHERNDEVLERIYIGRRFRNDTERLEKAVRAIHQDDRQGESGVRTSCADFDPDFLTLANSLYQKIFAKLT